MAQLEQREPFRAVVERIWVEDLPRVTSDPVLIGLKTETGDRICVVGQQADVKLSRFARNLKKGQAYEFPTVWLEFKAKNEN